MRESEIEKRFCWAVARLGGVTFKFKSPTHVGVSDRIACLPNGETWFVELKAPRGRLSEMQKEFRSTMRLLNQHYECLSSTDAVDMWLYIRENPSVSVMDVIRARS